MPPNSLGGGVGGADSQISFLPLVFSTRILSIDPHILACQIAAPRNRLASTKPKIHSDLDIRSTTTPSTTVTPEIASDARARNRAATAKNHGRSGS